MSDPSADMPAAVRNTQVDRSLPFSDVQDFDDVDRGFIAALEPGIVRNTDGHVVWDSDSYAFLDDDCPPTVNPSLWRQSRLCARQGLFEVTERIYQVRGLDLSNMTLVEGDTGVIVIDPLISAETAAAGLALYRAHRGDRPVTAVIYTHSHIDHFGGVKGVTTVEDVAAGRCPVLAPAGFVEHAVAENVYAGTAMGRRAAYMYGAALPRGPRGAVGAGLGPTTSTGTPTLIAPTIDIEHTGQTETVDGEITDPPSRRPRERSEPGRVARRRRQRRRRGRAVRPGNLRCILRAPARRVARAAPVPGGAEQDHR